MRLTYREHDVEIFEKCLSISDKSFDFVERPTRGIFESNWKSGEVFVNDDLDPNAYAILINRNGPWLWSIAVAQDWRRGGIASHLLTEVIAFAKTAGDHLTLTVRSDNAPAQILYLKNGFQPVKIIPKYYSSGIDGVIMTLKF